MPYKNPREKKEYQARYYQKNKERYQEYREKWESRNKELRREINRNYYYRNKEKIGILMKKWRETHRIQIRLYDRNFKARRKTDPKFRIDRIMGTAIWESLRGRKAGHKWESLVGYTKEDLIKHLEKQFDDKMNWGNYSSYWWIDHKKPRALFHYSTLEDSEFKECWALKNLQPLEKIANIKKGKSYVN